MVGATSLDDSSASLRFSLSWAGALGAPGRSKSPRSIQPLSSSGAKVFRVWVLASGESVRFGGANLQNSWR